MKCQNCGTEMENGYTLQLGTSGTIRVVKLTGSLVSGRVEVSVCPTCGKLETYVDYKSIR